MRGRTTYYLVDGAALPEVYLKVVEAKKMLRSGRAATVNEAAQAVGISRSAFYKYKDSIQSFNEKGADSTVTINAILRDEPGVLSKLLNVFAGAGCNVLTINQNIPYNEVAPISVAFRTENMVMDIETLIERLYEVDGTVHIDLIGSK